MPSATRIVDLAELPEDTTSVVTLRDRTAEEGFETGAKVESGAEVEAVLVRVADGGVSAWLNRCQHLTHVPLDKGSGAPLRNGELVCTNHGAYFETDTGLCTHGPCEGAYLNEVDVAVEDGAIVLVDDRYEFVRHGPIPGDPTALSSTSNVEF